jgi:hypothetical protein
MATTVTEVYICNRALSLINKKALTGTVIASATGEAKSLAQCQLLYDTLRDELLKLAPWDFALATSSLTEDTGAVPDSTWTKAFDLPTDMLHPWYVGDSRFTPLQPEWQIWDNHLVTNETSVTLTYVKQQTDPLTFTQLFVTALAYRLAMEMAIPLANSDELYNRLERNYNKNLRLAMKQNTRRKFERRDIYPRTPMQKRGHYTSFDTDDTA